MTTKWPNVRLGEVLKLCDTSVPASQLTEVNLAGVYSFARGLFRRGPMSPAKTSYKAYNRLVADDFVISQPKAWEGALARVTPEFEGWYLSPVFPTFRANRERLEPAFLEWFCKRKPVWEELQQNSRGIGARRETVSPEQFLLLQIPLPPVAEQRRIVARIDVLTTKIEEARRLREQALQHDVPLLRDQLFRRVFRFDSETGEFGARPLVKLDDICTLITDGTHQTPHYVDEGMPFLSAQNVKPYKFMPANHRKVSLEDYRAYIRHTKPEKGDVLMTRVGAMIGEAAIIDIDFDFAFYVSLCLIKPMRGRVHVPYLVHWLNSPFGIAAAKEKTLGKGHSQGNLNLKLIREFTLPLPAIEEQVEIAHRLDNIHARLQEIRAVQSQTAAEIDALMPSILDKAFRGEL